MGSPKTPFSIRAVIGGGLLACAVVWGGFALNRHHRKADGGTVAAGWPGVWQAEFRYPIQDGQPATCHREIRIEPGLAGGSVSDEWALSSGGKIRDESDILGLRVDATGNLVARIHPRQAGGFDELLVMKRDPWAAGQFVMSCRPHPDAPKPADFADYAPEARLTKTK